MSKPTEDEIASELIINPDFSYVSPKDGKTYKMTIKEKLFCDYYLDFKGDGVDAVFEAGYEAKNAMVAAAISYENLRKPNLIAYINSKLEEAGFNDDEVYKQHLFLLNQHADLKTKAKAVEMYYKLKGINAPEKSVSLNVNAEVEVNNPDVQEANRVLNEYFRNKRPGNGDVSSPVDTQTQDKE